jgi:hypothetical protein
VAELRVRFPAFIAFIGSDDEGGNQTTTRFFSVADGDAAAPR